MTRYNDYVPDEYGDFDEQIHDASVSGYREGVDRVLEYLGFDEYANDIRRAIKEGII